MDIDRVISRIKIIKETPTNNIGGGDIGTYDKFLFPPSEDLLSQDYQTPGESGESKWRFSNVYPVQKLSLSDIDTMVDASKEYTNMIDDRRIKNVMNMVRSIKEEAIANAVGDGSGVAGLTGEPPVNLKKKKRPTIIARGLMPGARKRWSNGRQ
tara:strand:- start:3231 stop:3692 length:462 start_codon:yes stop_codon:yes gene_type:complete